MFKRLLAAWLIFGCMPLHAQAAPRPQLLHVSYDATRELFTDYNKAFSTAYEAEHGVKPRIRMSHGGSGKQARAVADGLPADIVSLALAFDIDVLKTRKLVGDDWQNSLPHASAPFYSSIVLLVRKGNPKQIHDWDDLIRPDVAVITPNPKTSGGARWGYLAAWAYASDHFADDKGRDDFMCDVIARVPLWDTGARAATTSFIRRLQGDVLIAWENEAYIARKYLGEDTFEVIAPSITIRAEPKIAMLEPNVKQHANAALVKAYVDGLYSDASQAMIAQHFFRPVNAKFDTVLPRYESTRIVSVDDLGGFASLQKEHFAEGGLFDRCSLRAQKGRR